MKTETLSLLQCPIDGGNLTYAGQSVKGQLICRSGSHVFPVQESIPQFIQPAELTGLNKKYSTLYSWISPFYDSSFFIASSIRNQFWPAGEEKARCEIIDKIEIKRGDKLLETGIGTGANIPYLHHKVEDISIYGLDIAPGMLRQCARQCAQWGLDVDLFLASGESLPFRNERFDAVFHVGGINAFTDKQAAVNEMIRVAKPGTRIVIADEIEELAAEAGLLSKMGMNLFFGKQLTAEILEFHVANIPDLVPDQMHDVQLDTIWEGKGYLLSFRKP